MTITDRIEINPKVMLGKPVIRGTRITVELILRKLSEGASEADLLDEYPRLTPQTPLRTLGRGRRASPQRRKGGIGGTFSSSQQAEGGEAVGPVAVRET
ncbi:MAG: DUF433 domain-containing protein, partial [Anaerolineae bacterium]